MVVSSYVGVRAKRALMSNDQRQLTALEGTMGRLIAVGTANQGLATAR